MINGRVETRTEHFLTYLANDMDVRDRNDMKGNCLVMDHAPIHTSTKVRELVESRGYKYFYILPYSPFLHPIEKFWSKIKAGIRTKNSACQWPTE